MKKVLEALGTVLLVVGGCGVVRELTGWSVMGFTRHLVEHIGFVQGRELYTYIVLAVAGVAALTAAERASR
ncbi:hypothetical protein ABT160_04225 [Streptomyces sp. NPDC001941]|uniref:hypothetical protein n=1 Tax=Streptomyces sp. NPDC001941 TaxID=3154659 RepID=UPI003332B055